MGSIGFIELAGVSAIAAMLTLGPQNAERNAQNPQNPQNPRQESASTQQQGQNQKSSDELTVTGCLTASARGDAFVLTPLEKDPLAAEMTARTTDVTPTYTYELTGGRNLRAHVGQRVSITGMLDRSVKKEAEVDRERQTQAAPARQGQPEAKVQTEEKAEFEVRRLQVKTVKSIGKPCVAPSSE